ncbi:PLP-dependent aminotransferase family protein [Sphingomonas cannabina]|uniref:MocR-like pyridoxine biosynthesis transcription factor PdxR n=1 Tax=Sphingomonas cannabina TaxID=2899123 RepID=UPI001F357B32|nr:PLP-dependent aminotransferase family protein [Sphingomonas cannabina]UIJ47110.1 PLP-dependent aminotransferase family protein [Sphingomonas cannabina]
MLDRGAAESLGSQLRRRLLEAIRSGALRSGVRLPSTRALAAQLGISRPLVVDAYAQLAAEGYLALRQGARPVVIADGSGAPITEPPPPSTGDPIRFDHRPAMPDVTLFPRKAWVSAIRTVLRDLSANDLGYGDLRGSPLLRRALADYLGRVRGVIADPSRIFITSGFAEARALVCAAFHARGIRRLAVEDPSYSDWIAVDKAGLSRIPVPVDPQGMQVEALASSDAEAAFVTPAHQFPIGGVLSAGRRQYLVRWLRDRDALALEDDYDAEFRYDQAPVGALQGLAPDRIVYAGTASKTLAPALRLGWLVVPPGFVGLMNTELRRWSEGPPRIDQDALADLIVSGGYDRHLRRMRRLYRDRRNHLLSRLEDALPGLEVEGAAAGLHVTVRLPEKIDANGETAILAALLRRGLAAEGLRRYSDTAAGPRRLFLGYGRISESGIDHSIRILSEVILGGRGHSR